MTQDVCVYRWALWPLIWDCTIFFFVYIVFFSTFIHFGVYDLYFQRLFESVCINMFACIFCAILQHFLMVPAKSGFRAFRPLRLLQWELVEGRKCSVCLFMEAQIKRSSQSAECEEAWNTGQHSYFYYPLFFFMEVFHCYKTTDFVISTCMVKIVLPKCLGFLL